MNFLKERAERVTKGEMDHFALLDFVGSLYMKLILDGGSLYGLDQVAYLSRI